MLTSEGYVTCTNTLKSLCPSPAKVHLIFNSHQQYRWTGEINNIFRLTKLLVSKLFKCKSISLSIVPSSMLGRSASVIQLHISHINYHSINLQLHESVHLKLNVIMVGSFKKSSACPVQFSVMQNSDTDTLIFTQKSIFFLLGFNYIWFT